MLTHEGHYDTRYCLHFFFFFFERKISPKSKNFIDEVHRHVCISRRPLSTGNKPETSRGCRLRKAVAPFVDATKPKFLCSEIKYLKHHTRSGQPVLSPTNRKYVDPLLGRRWLKKATSGSKTPDAAGFVNAARCSTLQCHLSWPRGHGHAGCCAS